MTTSEVQAELIHDWSATYLKPKELVVLQSKGSNGFGSQNPLSNVTFYNKNQEVEDTTVTAVRY
jgi:hypothetical protein